VPLDAVRARRAVPPVIPANPHELQDSLAA
jgi:hypothetical protein